MLREVAGDGSALRMSPMVMMPTRRPASSTTGKRRISSLVMIWCASGKVVSGLTVMTSVDIQSRTSSFMDVLSL